VPTVAIGGSRQKYSGGAVAGNIIFGSEFGANPTSINGRFPEWRAALSIPEQGLRNICNPKTNTARDNPTMESRSRQSIKRMEQGLSHGRN
jgi:hypothetical protein